MIALEQTCPCGTHAVIEILSWTRKQHRWRVACPRCYDPTPRSDDEGPAAAATCEGFGETADQAVSDWLCQAERVWDIDYLPNTLFAELSEQAGDEADRQEGWMLCPCPAVRSWPAGNWWAPKPAGVGL